MTCTVRLLEPASDPSEWPPRWRPRPPPSSQALRDTAGVTSWPWLPALLPQRNGKVGLGQLSCLRLQAPWQAWSPVGGEAATPLQGLVALHGPGPAPHLPIHLQLFLPGVSSASRTPALPGCLAAPSSVLGAHVWDRKGTRVLHARPGSHPTHATKVQTTAGFLSGEALRGHVGGVYGLGLNHPGWVEAIKQSQRKSSPKTSGGAEGRTHCFCPKQDPQGQPHTALGTTGGTGLSSESMEALRALTRSGSMPPSSWSNAQRGRHRFS